MPIFDKSNKHLVRAEKTIPLGSQTFSKSRTQYPVGISPLFASKVNGPYLWDLDGQKYIDLVSSLAAITLGYNDSGVNRAVSKQLKKATSMSLPGVLEAEVSGAVIGVDLASEIVWYKGIWEGGRWFGGTWISGTWKLGDWYAGTWNSKMMLDC